MIILARHAEALFWVGRYLERTETTSRWLDIASGSIIHLSDDDAVDDWARLLRSLELDDAFAATGRAYDHARVADFLLCADDNPGSVNASLAALRNNLRVVRDRIPVELWEEANRLYLRLAGMNVETRLHSEAHEIYAMIRRGCQAISGVISEAMSRDEGHAFIEIGRMLERSILTVSLIRVEHERHSQHPDGERLLRSSSALQAYRRAHGHNANLLSTSQFLLESPDVPRSVLSCLKRAEGRLELISPDSKSLNTPRRLVGRLRAQLEFGDTAEELAKDPIALFDGIERALHELAAIASTQISRPVGDPALHAQFVRPGGEV